MVIMLCAINNYKTIFFVHLWKELGSIKYKIYIKKICVEKINVEMDSYFFISYL